MFTVMKTRSLIMMDRIVLSVMCEECLNFSPRSSDHVRKVLISRCLREEAKCRISAETEGKWTNRPQQSLVLRQPRNEPCHRHDQKRPDRSHSQHRTLLRYSDTWDWDTIGPFSLCLCTDPTCRFFSLATRDEDLSDMVRAPQTEV